MLTPLSPAEPDFVQQPRVGRPKLHQAPRCSPLPGAPCRDRHRGPSRHLEDRSPVLPRFPCLENSGDFNLTLHLPTSCIVESPSPPAACCQNSTRSDCAAAHHLRLASYSICCLGLRQVLLEESTPAIDARWGSILQLHQQKNMGDRASSENRLRA